LPRDSGWLATAFGLVFRSPEIKATAFGGEADAYVAPAGRSPSKLLVAPKTWRSIALLIQND